MGNGDEDRSMTHPDIIPNDIYTSDIYARLAEDTINKYNLKLDKDKRSLSN